MNTVQIYVGIVGVTSYFHVIFILHLQFQPSHFQRSSLLHVWFDWWPRSGAILPRVCCAITRGQNLFVTDSHELISSEYILHCIATSLSCSFVTILCPSPIATAKRFISTMVKSGSHDSSPHAGLKQEDHQTWPKPQQEAQGY